LKVNGFIESFSTLKTEQHFFESDENCKEKDRSLNPEEIFRTKTKDVFTDHSRRQTHNELTKSKTVVSKSSNYVYKNKIPEGYTEVVLKGDPVAIVCQNINNYMGGVSNIWNNSKKIGVELFNAQTNSDVKLDGKMKKEEEKKVFEELIKAEQNFGDGKLEFFGFDSGFSFGLEKIFSGFATKIYQGSGPILIKFKEINSKV
jgi:Diacylglycerol kinase accessory domain